MEFYTGAEVNKWTWITHTKQMWKVSYSLEQKYGAWRLAWEEARVLTFINVTLVGQGVVLRLKCLVPPLRTDTIQRKHCIKTTLKSSSTTAILGPVFCWLYTCIYSWWVSYNVSINIMPHITSTYFSIAFQKPSWCM